MVSQKFGTEGEYECRIRLENIPSSLVVITDGEGDYPDEAEAGNIPVLWLIAGERKAPWGRCVRIDK